MSPTTTQPPLDNISSHYDIMKMMIKSRGEGIPKEADVLRSSSLNFGMKTDFTGSALLSAPADDTTDCCLLNGVTLFIGVGINFSLE